MDAITWIFLIAGALLIASEFVQLSLVSVFLGVSALVVGGLRALGVVESIPLSLLAWSLVSLGLTVPLRPLVRRLLPAGERKFDHAHEDKDAMGVVVDVEQAVDDASSNGRIRFQGTTWSATSTVGTLAKGQKAKILYRDKMVWVVEPLEQLGEAAVVPTFTRSDDAAVGVASDVVNKKDKP